jgi:hypothetical protein
MTEDPNPATDENPKKDSSPTPNTPKGKEGELPEAELNKISGGVGSGDPCEGGEVAGTKAS